MCDCYEDKMLHMSAKFWLQIAAVNVERSKGGTTGPPPFVSFKDGGSSGKDVHSLQTKPPLKSGLQANSQKGSRSEREKISHPSRVESDRVGSASAVKPKSDDMRPGRGRGRGSGFSDDSRRAPTQPESRMQHGEGKRFGFQQDRRQEESSVAGGRGRGRHQYSVVEKTAEVAVAGKHDRGPQFEGNPSGGGFHRYDEGRRNLSAQRKRYEPRLQHSQPLRDSSSSQLSEWLDQKLKLGGMVFTADNTTEEMHKQLERRIPHLEKTSSYEDRRRDGRPQQQYEDFHGSHYSGEIEQAHEVTHYRRHLYDHSRPATSRGLPDHVRKPYQETLHELWSKGEGRQADTKVQGDGQLRDGVQREREPRPRGKEGWVEEANPTNSASGSRPTNPGHSVLRPQQSTGDDQYSWDWVNKSAPHSAVRQSH